MEAAIQNYSSVLRSTTPVSPASNPPRWPSLADLRGAALPCLLLMTAFPQAVKSEWLAQTSGYGRDSILHGLARLAGYRLVLFDHARRAWSLTELGARFSVQLGNLFEMGFVQPENLDEAERNMQTPSENLDETLPLRPENQGAVDNHFDLRPENQGAVEKTLPLRPENQGSVDNRFDLRPENQGAVEKTLLLRPENQGEAGALSLKEVKEEESFKESEESSSRLTSRLTPHPAGVTKKPEGDTENDHAGLVARLLQHSLSLFGEPLLGSPADYPDLRRLLAVMAEAYHNRHRLRKPARVAFVNYRQGYQPDPVFWDASNRYLPREFHAQVGLPYRSPYRDSSMPEDLLPEPQERPDEPSARSAPGVDPSSIRSWQDCWQNLRSKHSRATRAQYLDDLILLDCDLRALEFTIGCRDVDSQAWLQEHARDSLKCQLSRDWGKRFGVRFVVWPELDDG